MTIATVREFRDRATGVLRSKSPVIVTRRGRLAGVYFPWPEGGMPLEMKRELFSVFADQLRRDIKKHGLTETEVLEDFSSWRKERNAARRRR